MARPRKPAATLRLAGAFQKDPARARDDLVASGPVGPWRPGSTDPARVWDELCQLAPPGLLKTADRPALEILARLIALVRSDARALTAARVAQVIALCDRFGLTPRARQQLDAAPEADDPHRLHRELLARQENRKC